MRKKFTLLALPFCILVFSFHANAALIALNFDDISGNGIAWASDRYLTSHEIKFDAIDAPMYAYDDPSPGHGGEYVATSGLTYIYAGAPSHGNSAFTVTFFENGDLDNLAVTDFLQFDVVDYANETLQTWSYRVFDINGDTLFNETGTASGETVQISTDSARIHGFTFTPSADTEGLDSFVFEEVISAKTANVPEPSSVILLTLAALGFIRRKQLPS